MKEHNILLWSGLEYDSREFCEITSDKTGVLINSVIIGNYEKGLYKVSYTITTNEAWQTTAFEISYTINGAPGKISGQKKEEEKWFINNESRKEFDHCTDIDIPLTPFTNSLPINRLRLDIGEKKIISVIYLDILAFETRPVQQQYTRVSAHVFNYQNIPNDFEADITVNENGLVTAYPQLFTLINTI